METITLQEAAILLNCKSVKDLKGHCQIHEVQIYSEKESRKKYVFKIDLCLNCSIKDAPKEKE